MRWVLMILFAAFSIGLAGCATDNHYGRTEPNLREGHMEWPDVGGNRDDHIRDPMHQR